jgi:hypothetical protein
LSDEFYLKKEDEVYFKKQNDFWMVRTTSTYTFESAQLLKEPFKSFDNKNKFINILGLILEYNEKDATVSVVDMNEIVSAYAKLTNCQFKLKNVSPIDDYSMPNSFKTLFQNDSINTMIGPHYIIFLDQDYTSLNRNDSSINKVDNRQLYASHTWKRGLLDYSVPKHCLNLYQMLLTSTRKLKNLNSYWSPLWRKVIGVVDYVDPVQAVLRTWDLKFAVLPCQLKWSNNLMMIIPKNSEDEGKCLKFMASSDGEIFVVIATTPSDQNTWYIFQITTKGVIFYRVSFIESNKLHFVYM